MPHYIVEIALWILLAFFIGCLIGYLLRQMFAASAELPQVEEAQVPVPLRATEAALQTVAAPVVETAVPEPAPEPSPEPMPVARMARPKGLGEARGNKPDALQRISGIGPKYEKILHTLGFFHFDQIASWTGEQVAWVDDHLKFNGRIGRERWIEQARLLAEGREEEFHTQYGTGGRRNEAGIAEPGSRTRRP